MTKVFENTEKEFYMDGFLKSNLDSAKRGVKLDWDMLFLYDGGEGTGKSVKAMQDAFYCDPTLTLDRITFTPDEFKKAILEAKKYQAIIFDEAYTGLSSRAAMSRINRTLVALVAEIRQKNLFIFVVMPTFFDLDRYVALWRSRILIHVYSKGFQRGYFAFYDSERKNQIYMHGKKFYDYSVNNIKPNFRGRFSNYYPLDEKEYRKKKHISLIKDDNSFDEEELNKQVEELLFSRVQEMDCDLTHKFKQQILSMSEKTYYRRLKKYREEL